MKLDNSANRRNIWEETHNTTSKRYRDEARGQHGGQGSKEVGATKGLWSVRMVKDCPSRMYLKWLIPSTQGYSSRSKADHLTWESFNFFEKKSRGCQADLPLRSLM
jgi:hypothetical protein